MRIKTIFESFMALPLLLSVVSCQDKMTTGFVKGEAVRFSVGADVGGTKAAYSGATDTEGTIERIDWQAGDLIRIYCGQVSEPSDKFADYRVTNDITAVGSISKARIEGVGGAGLRWGEGAHTFYAVFPSPESGGAVTGIGVSPYMSAGVKSSVATSINGATVTADLPALQAFIGGITETPSGSGNFIAAPDLKNMLMTAKNGPFTETPGIPEAPEVFLSFIPLSTAIKFTIENGTGSDLNLESVSLISGNYKANAPALNGEFTVNLDNMSKPADVKPFDDSEFTISYLNEYPECTGTGDTGDLSLRTASIDFSGGTDGYLTIARGKTLTFTFFLVPTHHFEDLTFKLTKSDGSWMSTRLGYIDGDGIFFPKFKKTTVTGLLVPEGAQWNVKYDSEVLPWNANGDGGNVDLSYPGSSERAFVTGWETGISSGIDLDIEEGDEFDITGAVVTDYKGAGDKTYSVKSSAPWKLQYKLDGGDWTDAVANTAIGESGKEWIRFDTVSGVGSESAVTVTATVTASSGTAKAITVNHDDNLRNAPARGTESAPWDLSIHDIHGNLNTDGKAVTANCYVISSPGWYAFPLVYGNAVKGGALNKAAYCNTGGSLDDFVKDDGSAIPENAPYVTGATKAYPLWEDVPSFALIPEDGCTVLTQSEAFALGLTGCSCGYVMFEVKKDALTQGNAVIAVSTDTETDILWSWHIWVTDADLTPVTVKNYDGTFNRGMFPLNLGWVDGSTSATDTGYPARSLDIRFVQIKGGEVKNESRTTVKSREHITEMTSSTGGSSPTWQWGRKDPFIRSDGSSTDEIAGTGYSVHSISVPITKTEGSVSIQTAIKKPATFYYNPSTSSPSWCTSNTYYNLWSAANKTYGSSATGYKSSPVKTVYDPCPPGYEIPQANAFTGFTTTGGTSLTASQFNVRGSFTDGWYFYTSLGSGNKVNTGGPTVFFPARGFRRYSDGSFLYGDSGYYWSAIPYSGKYIYYLYFLSSGVTPINSCGRAYGFPIRPVQE